jgi:DnaJ like chaperone protein
MSVWGKIVGAAAGFMIWGGPIGALMGALAGHYWVDKGEQKKLQDRERGAERDRQREPSGWRAGSNQDEVVFSVGVIALFAKMAKADGQVTRDEIAAFNRVFHVPEAERVHVGRIFDLAKQSVAGFDSYAQQLAGIFRGRTEVLTDLLDALFLVAKADGNFHPEEENFLRQVARIFGVSEDEFTRIRESHFGADRRDPYRVLGVSRDISDEELKRIYHAAVKRYHPDSLMARGVPKEFIDVATEKLAAINGAYEQVKRERGA